MLPHIASVTSCPEVPRDTHCFDHTSLHRTTPPANNNNKPAEYKQSLVKLHIFFAVQQKDISPHQPPHPPPTECLIGLWPRVRLEGFSWAVTGEAGTAVIQTKRSQSRHTRAPTWWGTRCRRNNPEIQQIYTADCILCPPPTHPQYKLFVAHSAQHMRKFTHYQDDITSPLHHPVMGYEKCPSSWFLLVILSYLTWQGRIIRVRNLELKYLHFQCVFHWLLSQNHWPLVLEPKPKVVFLNLQ